MDCRQGETFTDFTPPNGLLAGVEYSDCVFENCRWVGVRVQNCAFLDCTFRGCSFSGVVFSFTRMRDAWLKNSSFRSMAWGGLQGRGGLGQPIAKAEGCAFQYNEFSGMALAGFDFSGCSFSECGFDDCRLHGASFRGCRLGRTQYTRCDLTEADFRDAEAYGIAPADNRLKGARFSFPEVVTLLDGTGIRIE